MNLSLVEAIDVAQNRPLWRLMSTFGACQKLMIIVVTCAVVIELIERRWPRWRHRPTSPRPSHPSLPGCWVDSTVPRARRARLNQPCRSLWHPPLHQISHCLTLKTQVQSVFSFFLHSSLLYIQGIMCLFLVLVLSSVFYCFYCIVFHFLLPCVYQIMIMIIIIILIIISILLV